MIITTTFAHSVAILILLTIFSITLITITVVLAIGTQRIAAQRVGENLLPFAWNHPTIQIRHVVINSDLINADDVKKRELITDEHQHAMRTTRMTMREIFDCIPCAPGSENMRERNYLSLRCSQLAHITDYTVQDYDQCDVSLLMLSTMPRGDAVPPPKGRVVVLRDAVPAKYEKVRVM